MSFNFLGLMGSATGSGTSVTVPVSGFPDFSDTDTIAALLFMEFEPGVAVEGDISVTDDALTSDSTVFGARWSPWNNAEFLALVGSSTDPPTAGPVNPWVAANAQVSSGAPIKAGTVQGSYFALLCPIFAPPNNITVAFTTPQTYVKVDVYGVQGLVMLPFNQDTPAPDPNSFTWFDAGPENWPHTLAETMNPGFFFQLVTHAPTSATTLNVVTDGSSTTEDVIATQDGTAEGGLTWREILAMSASVAIDWDGAGRTAESVGLAIGAPTISVPDALTISATTSSTFMGSFTRWVVTIVDSAGIPSNSTTHLARAFWRILEAPGGGGGLDGNWSENATDLASDGKYVVQNPVDSGYYIDVPAGMTWTLRGVMYDGFYSNEVDVTLGSPLGGAPFFHAHYAGV